MPEGEWKSLENRSQFISFIQVPDWLIIVKFQRPLEDAIKNVTKVCNKVRKKIFTSVLDSLELLYLIIELLIICVAYEVSIDVFAYAGALTCR